MLGAVLSFLVSCLVSQVSSHGRLIEPPSRASMWRYGFNTPPNYNDHELYCGGFTRQWQVNGGKCGICGDPWEQKPRAHEAGGKYATGTIVRKYKAGSMFTIRVEVTANHRGHFEFRLCPNNKPKVAATQECLDKYVLRRGRMSARDPEDEEFHDTWFYPSTENKVYEMRYMLPPDLTCTQCVLQWKYIAGNNWGMCPNGTGKVGCGHQEEFRACADVQITDGKGEADDTPYPTVKPTRRPVTPRPVTVPATSTLPSNATEDYIDNEIPDDDAISETSGGGSEASESSDGWFGWLFTLFDSIRKLFVSFLGRSGGSPALTAVWSGLPVAKKLRLFRRHLAALGLKSFLDQLR